MFVIIGMNALTSFSKHPAASQAYYILYNTHIIYVTETWVCSDIHDEEITSAGFNVVRADRNHAQGGGVAVFL